MALLDKIRQRVRPVIGPLAVACAVAYFGYHAVQGDRGVVAWLKLGQQTEEARSALAMSRAEQRRLAVRVALLRPDNLDPDMLDERARVVLNLAAPDEVVIYTNTP